MLSSKSNSGNMCDTMWSQVRQVWYNIKTANSGSIQTMPTQQIGSHTLVNQVWHNSKTETHLASPSPPALHTKTTSCYLSQIKWRGLDEQNQIDRRTKNIWCSVDFLWTKHQNQTSEPNSDQTTMLKLILWFHHHSDEKKKAGATSKDLLLLTIIAAGSLEATILPVRRPLQTGWGANGSAGGLAKGNCVQIHIAHILKNYHDTDLQKIEYKDYQVPWTQVK